MRPVLFTTLFYGWTFLAGIMVLPLLFGPPRPLMAYSRFWIRGALWLLRTTVGLSHRVVGRENIPDGPALFAVKHQSAWDTLAINLIVRDAAIVLKRELTWIPLFGWCLIRTRQIAIDRTGGISALRGMVRAGGQTALPRGHIGLARRARCPRRPRGTELGDVLAAPVTQATARGHHDRVSAPVTRRSSQA